MFNPLPSRSAYDRRIEPAGSDLWATQAQLGSVPGSMWWAAREHSAFGGKKVWDECGNLLRPDRADCHNLYAHLAVKCFRFSFSRFSETAAPLPDVSLQFVLLDQDDDCCIYILCLHNVALAQSFKLDHVQCDSSVILPSDHRSIGDFNGFLPFIVLYAAAKQTLNQSICHDLQALFSRLTFLLICLV